MNAALQNLVMLAQASAADAPKVDEGTTVVVFLLLTGIFFWWTCRQIGKKRQRNWIAGGKVWDS